LEKITVQLHADYSDKAVSPGKSCAILYKSTASSEVLAVYNFAPSSGNSAIEFATITALVNGIDMGTTSF